jgi:PEP-CTERM motif
MQVGGADYTGTGHAARWFGTAASYEDMNPSRFTHSEARAMFGNKMVGWAQGPAFSGSRGILWNGGNAEDYVDLTPDGIDQSFLMGMDANQQVGIISDANINVSAGLWTGTASSFIDLGPAGSTSSYAFAVANGRQGGEATIGQNHAHAYLWSGTAASALDIHPDVANSSQVSGMSSNFQVGRVDIDVQGAQTSKYHAAFWSGTSNSWVDLHSFLPSAYQISEATSIVEYADRVEVYGFARAEALGDDAIAVMWTQPVPEPGSVLAIVIGLAGLARLRRKSK